MYTPYQQPPPGPYGRAPEYGSFPGATGMGPPPGMTASAPGTTSAPPGVQSHESPYPQPAHGAGLPTHFQPPANMPNINFSAPVIRLGTSAPSKTTDFRDDRTSSKRSGVTAGVDVLRLERVPAITPSTKEEIIRTVFVGGITEGTGGDEGIERILRAAGNLRRWIRATDADEKVCKFGFAEFEDAESLRTAMEVLVDVEVPVQRQMPRDGKGENGEDVKEVEKSKLLIILDENSKSYIEQYESSRGNSDPTQIEMRLDHARSALQAVLSNLANPSAPTAKYELSKIDQDGDFHMADGVRVDGSSAEIVNIPLTVEDELSDIPAEMRETVAKEITSFRERSIRRDLERMKREEEMELQERNRMMNGGRLNRLASPPLSAPSGPAAGANGIPVGPRDRTLNAPSGPKAFGQQIPRDYQKGVTFVNGTGFPISTSTAFDDSDTDASDSELERRRNGKKDAELEKAYLDQERRWLNRERSRTAAVDREKNRDKEEEDHAKDEKDAMAKRLRGWDDDIESSRKVEEYYQDRSMWTRNRASFRSREITLDDTDRAAETRERARDTHQRERAAGAMADDFLNRQAEEMQLTEAPAREPARFKLSLGAAAQKAQANTQQQKRTMAEVEGLLEDEEEDSSDQKRTLIPIQFDSAAEAAGLNEEERAQAARQLAQDIPTSKEGLWAWEVKWEFVDEGVISERLKPFVEKKIVEYLGVQEQMLVDVVEGHLRSRGGPAALVDALEGALDEEAEVLVKKLWRMVIFFSESEKRGLST